MYEIESTTSRELGVNIPNHTRAKARVKGILPAVHYIGRCSNVEIQSRGPGVGSLE
jgi:hypothetical protein